MGNLTKNFSTKEFVTSETYPDLAGKIAINRIDQVKMFYLARMILQPVRDKFGQAIVVTSGKRSKLLNMVVGGVSSSDHRYRNYSAAADWKFANADRGLLWKAYLFLMKTAKNSIGQMIIYLDQAGLPIFIHTSLATEKNQSEFLVKQAGKYREYDPKKDPHND